MVQALPPEDIWWFVAAHLRNHEDTPIPVLEPSVFALLSDLAVGTAAQSAPLIAVN